MGLPLRERSAAGRRLTRSAGKERLKSRHNSRHEPPDQAFAGYFGSEYPVGRVAANTVGGRIQSTLQGRPFVEGARSGFAFSALAYLNVQMRKEMIAQSKLHPTNDGTGLSRGMFGDFFKLAVVRWSQFLTKQIDGILGGMQKGVGSFFGISYGPDSLPDMINESYAGPHDYSNNFFGFYLPDGTGRDLRHLNDVQKYAYELVTNYTTSLIFATPFATGAIYEQAYGMGYIRVR